MQVNYHTLSDKVFFVSKIPFRIKRIKFSLFQNRIDNADNAMILICHDINMP